MKKFWNSIILCAAILFLCQSAEAENPTYLGTEAIMNRVFDSARNGIKARISGDALLATVTADNIVATTSLNIPNGNDPNVDTIGDISWDTNGQWIRTYDHTYGQVSIGQMNKSMTFVLEDPENVPTHAVRATKSKLVWQNTSGMTYRLTSIYGVSDTTGYYFKLYKSNTSADVDIYNQVTMDVVSCDNPMPAGGYYKNITSGFDNSTIETGKWLIWEHSGSSAEELSVVINGVLSADVN